LSDVEERVVSIQTFLELYHEKSHISRGEIHKSKYFVGYC